MTLTTLTKSDLHDSGLANLVFPNQNGRRRLTRGYRREAAEVLPGLHPLDPKFRDLVEYLSQEYETRFPTTLKDNFFSGTLSPSLDGRLMNIAGVGPVDTGYISLNNLAVREQLGLRSKLDVNHRALFRELFECMFTRGYMAPLKINSKSSQGAPLYNFDRDSKIIDTLKLFNDDLDQVLRAVNTGDGVKLLELGYSLIYTQNFRLSADKVGKDRYYYTLPDKEGFQERMVTDRTVDGLHGREGYSCRGRHVFGLNNTMNNLIATWIRPCEAYYLKRYAFTWKHREAASTAADLQRYLEVYQDGVLQGVDVTSFDTTVPDFLLEAFVTEGIEIGLFTELFGGFVKKALRGQVFHPAPGVNQEAAIIGDPRTLEEVSHCGLLSGIYLVSSLGKFLNVFDVLCNLKEIGVNYEGKVHHFLLGDLDVRIKNMGDDGILMFPNAKMASDYFKVSSKGYFKTELEEGLVFLGSLYNREGAQVNAYPNLRSKLVNLFVPEKDWRSKFRRDFFWVGLQDYFVHGGNHPTFGNLVDLLNEGFLKFYHFSFGNYVEDIIDQNRHKAFMLNEADALFLSNPDSVHYKLDIDDVSDEVLNEFFNNIEFDQYQHICSKHLPGLKLQPLGDHYGY